MSELASSQAFYELAKTGKYSKTWLTNKINQMQAHETRMAMLDWLKTDEEAKYYLTIILGSAAAGIGTLMNKYVAIAAKDKTTDPDAPYGRDEQGIPVGPLGGRYYGGEKDKGLDFYDLIGHPEWDPEYTGKQITAQTLGIPKVELGSGLDLGTGTMSALMGNIFLLAGGGAVGIATAILIFKSLKDVRLPFSEGIL